MDDFENLIREARDGGQVTVDQLFAALYPEIRRAVRAAVGNARPELPLQATELASEAYLRLRNLRGANWQDSAHFVRTVARAARRALADEVRARSAVKRGGDLHQTTLVTLGQESPVPIEDMIALDDALEKMRAGPESLQRKAEVLDLYFFCGMAPSDIAEVLGITERTVRRDFAYARAWLRREIGT